MLNRRHLLQGMGGTAFGSVFLNSLAADAAEKSDLIVVAVYLQGGNDGLNTVIPLTQYKAYYNLRTPADPPEGLALAYTQAQLAPLAFDTNYKTAADKATEFAFAPGMTAMRSLYAAGNLAVIAGISLPLAEEYSLSHSNATLDWQTGQINLGEIVPPGWMGLALDKATAGPLGATMSLGGTTPLIVGAKHSGLVVNPPIDNYGISYSTSDNYKQLEHSFSKILSLPAANATAAYDLAVMTTAASSIDDIKAIAKAQPAKDYPPVVTYLDYQMRDIARLIVGGSGLRGYAAIQGSYDSHSSQALYQPALLNQLSTSLTTFYGYLQAQGASSNVVIVTISDFGRRPAANLDFGTDHGGGSVAFVLGDPVKGGVYGDYPSLKKFDVNGNLVMKVDFRNMLSDIITSMGGSAKSILGEKYPRLGFI
jgi:uncharacterized protein (DUF1501 family)